LLERGKRPTLIKLILYPVFTFLRIYFFNFGFLEGSAALKYAWYSGRYSFIKYSKARHLTRDKSYLESIIAKRFNELYKQFPDYINPQDSRLNYLLKSLSPLKDKQILEIGCGKGRFSNQISLNHARCFGIDVSENFLQIAKNKNQGTFLKSSATRLPFKDNSFDAAFAVEVIEHIPGLEKLIIEANNVLKPQGKLVIIDRNILSINNRRHFIPNLLVKKYHELKNDWMYPRNFAFTEKWFLGQEVSKILSKYFNKVEYRYIISDSEKTSKTAFLFRLLPTTRHFILWQASEPKKNYTLKSICKKNTSVIKEFNLNGNIFQERLAKYPKIFQHLENFQQFNSNTMLYPQKKNGFFSLRIDADQAETEDFKEYISLLTPFAPWVTIFFCASEFKGIDNLILKAKEAGMDIQSHAYYHHVYNDYQTNLHNLNKAKVFFQNLGINTTGFAAPMGKYNPNLMAALENLGYKYSSDFSYDYLNFPHYPKVKSKFSKILQIPIFPVCPELLFENCFSEQTALEYFLKSIPKIKAANVPIIIYAHTNPKYPQTKKLLKRLLDEISKDDSLYKANISDLASWCFSQEDKVFSAQTGLINKTFYHGFLKIPPAELFGKEIPLKFTEKVKCCLKNMLDYEIITPKNDLKSNKIKILIKLIFRKLCSKKQR